MCIVRCRYGTQGAWYFSDLAGIQIAQTTVQPPTASGFAKLLLKPVVSCEYLLQPTCDASPACLPANLCVCLRLSGCLSFAHELVRAGTWLLI